MSEHTPCASRGRLAAALGLLLALALIAGCSSSSEPGESTGTTPAGGDAAAPVTVTHKYGSTTIEGVPQRVVTLGAQWTDVLLSLGVQPVAYLKDPYTQSDDGRFPWQSDLSPDATPIIATATDIPLEQVVGLQPDLILATFATYEEPIFRDLERIAPTIPLLGDRGVDQWQDLLELGGKIFDKQDEAAAVRASVDQKVADLAAAHPQLEGKTFVMANFVAGDGIWVVADPEDGASTLFAELGLAHDPDILALPIDQGRAKLSLEQVSMLDADVLVLLTNGADPNEMVGYQSLPAVKSGAVFLMDYAQATGLNTPTPLSIPYLLDLLTPALEAAAKA